MTDPFPTIQDIERYADGELPASETAVLEAILQSDPELARRVERVLEERRKFRAALVRAVGTGAAPASVRERVQGLLRTELAEVPVAASAAAPPLRLVPARRRSAFLAGPARASWLAVAATLMLVAGSVLFGIFGPRIRDRMPVQSEDTPVSEFAAAVDHQHGESAALGTCTAQPQPWHDIEEASQALTMLLGRAVNAPDLSAAGYEFCCGGGCYMPGSGTRSAHLLYCLPAEGEKCEFLSIFMAPVETPLTAVDSFGRAGRLECGVPYTVASPNGGEMAYWCDGSITWFVKSSGPTDLDVLRRLFPE